MGPDGNTENSYGDPYWGLYKVMSIGTRTHAHTQPHTHTHTLIHQVVFFPFDPEPVTPRVRHAERVDDGDQPVGTVVSCYFDTSGLPAPAPLSLSLHQQCMYACLLHATHMRAEDKEGVCQVNPSPSPSLLVSLCLRPHIHKHACVHACTRAHTHTNTQTHTPGVPTDPGPVEADKCANAAANAKAAAARRGSTQAPQWRLTRGASGGYAPSHTSVTDISSAAETSAAPASRQTGQDTLDTLVLHIAPHESSAAANETRGASGQGTATAGPRDMWSRQTHEEEAEFDMFSGPQDTDGRRQGSQMVEAGMKVEIASTFSAPDTRLIQRWLFLGPILCGVIAAAFILCVEGHSAYGRHRCTGVCVCVCRCLQVWVCINARSRRSLHFCLPVSVCLGLCLSRALPLSFRHRKALLEFDKAIASGKEHDEAEEDVQAAATASVGHVNMREVGQNAEASILSDLLAKELLTQDQYAKSLALGQSLSAVFAVCSLFLDMWVCACV